MKRRKFTKYLCTFIIICLLFTMQVFAHSGRTDGNGGHRDNKNKSGLGYYHYHHGYGPHLHPNGVCPYDYVPEVSNTTKTAGYSTYVKKDTKIGIIVTDIKTFINENEIPTFLYNGNPNDTVIIAEDLSNYGFDKIWNQTDRTLTLILNAEKKTTPMVMDYYHDLEQEQYLFDIYKSDIKVLLKTSYESEAIASKKVYFLNGYTAISTDELKNFGTFNWDNESRKITVIIE